ncbi:MAG: KUP/HAK/KT family potassium transporter [Chitinophagales bacterium]|nr:KUP/HAK/KT family potassium transporter [Chitinophagales bacterium]
MSSEHHVNHKRPSALGFLLSLGIIYGDIGTSPLYVFNAIIGDSIITKELVYGGVSCVFWTLTLLTTIKYVILTLRADNNGEGGILSLYALIRRYKKWAVYLAIIGAATLLADGIITPPISVSSAIEGLKMNEEATMTIAIIIIAGLFIIQQFGTKSIGKLFGPIMLIWFLTLAIFGIISIVKHPQIFEALNPYYAFKLLSNNLLNGGIFILGAVFLSTTGAEALYSDLGHVGRANIRASWIFVKTCLILNYLGQAVWLLQYEGQHLNGRVFFGLFDENGLHFYAVAIATIAAIIASQALISGSFTLISEAIRLKLWPKMAIKYPTEMKGQLYIPRINWMMLAGCIFMVFHFRNSSNMEAAYGLSITITMLMTSVLLSIYMWTQRIKFTWIIVYLVVYLTIEIGFLSANLRKFHEGGYITVIVAGALIVVMYVWYRSRIIKNRYVEFVPIKDFLEALENLSVNKEVPKYSDHLIYMTGAEHKSDVEQKIMYSIFNKKPKRADFYWFIHVNTVDNPYETDYTITTIIPSKVYRIDLFLGFRVEQRIQAMFRKILIDMKDRGEIAYDEGYQKILQKKALGDYQFIVMEKYLNIDNLLNFKEKLTMRLYFFLKKFSLSEEKHFGLESNYVSIEKLPLIVATQNEPALRRIVIDEKSHKKHYLRKNEISITYLFDKYKE